jgi:hypothetical protein
MKDERCRPKVCKKKISMSDDEGERGAGLENESLLQMCHCDEKNAAQRARNCSIVVAQKKRNEGVLAFAQNTDLVLRKEMGEWGS